MSTSIEIPTRLGRPNRFVKGTRDAATGLKPADDGRLKIGPEPGLFHLVVTRDQLRHAVLLCQAISLEAERRGWEMRSYTEPGYGERPVVAIGIRAHFYPVEVHEVTERSPLRMTRSRSGEASPTGRPADGSGRLNSTNTGAQSAD